MPRWIVLIAVLAGLASFCAGALVGAHTQATASSGHGPLHRVASPYVVPR